MPNLPIDTIEPCAYGCGNTARFTTKAGKLVCETSSNKCPAIRAKNSNSIKTAHEEGRIPGWDTLRSVYHVETAWARGLTKEDHSSIAIGAEKLREYHAQQRLLQNHYRDYQLRCSFSFAADDIPKIEGYDLLKSLGMYNRHNNKYGVVRDHKFSVKSGYVDRIDPEIIKHPANCAFITHTENAKKTFTNSITLEELIERIRKW